MAAHSCVRPNLKQSFIKNLFLYAAKVMLFLLLCKKKVLKICSITYFFSTFNFIGMSPLYFR